MLESVPLRERIALAQVILGQRQEIAVSVTDAFFRHHPDRLIQFGEADRRRGIEDAGSHLDFLAGAIESGSIAAFEDYARWTSRLLSARGIAPEFLAENFQQLEQAIRPNLTGLHSVVKQLITAGCAACAPTDPELAAAQLHSALDEARRLFVSAILTGNRRAATQVAIEALREGHSIVDIYVEIFQESQYQIGRLWETNQITVGREHLATAVTQFVLAQIYPLIKIPDLIRGQVVITGVEGEMHQIGANLVADVLEADGWDVKFLGTNVPTTGVLDVIAEHDANVVGISATMLFSIPKVIELLNAIRTKFGPEGPKIILGGAAFRHAPNLAQELGADGFARDLRELDALMAWAN